MKFAYCRRIKAFFYLPTVLNVALLLQGEAFGNLFVYDRDTTSIVHKEQNKYVWTLMTNDSWIKDTFTIQQNFSEEKTIFGNVRGTVYKYSKDAEACVWFSFGGHFNFFMGNLHILSVLQGCVSTGTFQWMRSTHFSWTIWSTTLRFKDLREL